MKKLVIISLSLFFFCCSKYGVDFKIKNNSGYSIDSLTISNGSSSVTEYHLMNDSVNHLYLDFKNNSSSINKGDGSYSIIIYKPNSEKKTSFGYFSNGIPLVGSYDISIEKDSVLFQENLD